MDPRWDPVLSRAVPHGARRAACLLSCRFLLDRMPGRGRKRGVHDSRPAANCGIGAPMKKALAPQGARASFIPNRQMRVSNW